MSLPRFYTTKVAASRSANEIGEIVRKYGATQYSITFDPATNEPTELHFLMAVPNVGDVPVRLEAQIDGIVERLLDSRARIEPEDAERRAYRIAWRQIKAYVEMMLEMVENGLRDFHEAFMADVLVHAGGGEWLRLADAYERSGGKLALPSGKVVDVEAEVVE